MGTEYNLKNMPIADQLTPTSNGGYAQSEYQLETKTNGRSVLVGRQFHCWNKWKQFLLFTHNHFTLHLWNSTEHEANHISAAHVDGEEEAQYRVEIIIVDETT